MLAKEGRLNYLGIFTNREVKQVDVGCAVRTRTGAHGTPYIEPSIAGWGVSCNHDQRPSWQGNIDQRP